MASFTAFHASAMKSRISENIQSNLVPTSFFNAAVTDPTMLCATAFAPRRIADPILFMPLDIWGWIWMDPSSSCRWTSEDG